MKRNLKAIRPLMIILIGTLMWGTKANAQVPLSGYKLVFDDEFNGTAYDRTKWSDSSSAEADGGHGNQGNQQLEWNQGANCLVSNGTLTQVAKRQSFTSPSGKNYSWTSCLLTTTPSLSFQYGYIEERAKLPGIRGFWPAFWTWQAPGVNSWQETDVYEFYSDNRTRLYLTSHAGSGGGCNYSPPFDPSADFHTYGAMITPTGTTWYVDGVRVCSVAGSPAAKTNIITNLAVYAGVPPDATTTTATKQVDYIRAYSTDPILPAVTPQPGYNGPGAPALSPTPAPTAAPTPVPSATPVPPSATPIPPSSPLSGTRTLVAQHSGLCADVAAASTASGGRVDQWNCYRSPSQLFRITSVGGNQYVFTASHSGKCLEVSGKSKADGAAIVQQTCSGSANQRWTAKSMGNGSYSFVNANSGKCMDVAGASNAPGAHIIQWQCHGRANQQFKAN